MIHNLSQVLALHVDLAAQCPLILVRTLAGTSKSMMRWGACALRTRSRSCEWRPCTPRSCPRSASSRYRPVIKCPLCKDSFFVQVFDVQGDLKLRGSGPHYGAMNVLQENQQRREHAENPLAAVSSLQGIAFRILIPNVSCQLDCRILIRILISLF